MTERVEKLVDYRLRQASETLAAANELLQGEHLRDAVNRAYYAMFYEFIEIDKAQAEEVVANATSFLAEVRAVIPTLIHGRRPDEGGR